MIEVSGLCKRYGDAVAIDDVSFSVERGEVVGFLGPNGAGKTTTMRIISGSLGASAGTAKVGGHDVSENPRAVQAMLGYAPEVPPLYADMAVEDYVRFAATLKGVRAIEPAAEKAMEQLGLTKVRGRLIDHLSKGFRQRVGLAQALVHEPEVLILDEPTSGLDPAQRVELRGLFQALAAGERTVVISTHVLAEVEALCSRVIIISEGRVVGSPRIDGEAEEGRVVRIRLAEDPARLKASLADLPGVREVAGDGRELRITGDRDLRADIAGQAVPFGLLELTGRQRLEDIYMQAITRGRA